MDAYILCSQLVIKEVFIHFQRWSILCSGSSQNICRSHSLCRLGGSALEFHLRDTTSCLTTACHACTTAFLNTPFDIHPSILYTYVSCTGLQGAAFWTGTFLLWGEQRWHRHFQTSTTSCDPFSRFHFHCPIHRLSWLLLFHSFLFLISNMSLKPQNLLPTC